MQDEATGEDRPGGNKLAETRTDWAESRTDWAEDRTIQANERTFAGWMRTGMASVALALGLKALFGSFEPTWLAKAVASIFIAIAVALFWTAARNAAATLERLNDHRADPLRTGTFHLIAAGLTFGALATAAVLWLL